MLREKPFKIAFLVSLGFHSILLGPLTSVFNRPIELKDTHIEVTYVDIAKKKS